MGKLEIIDLVSDSDNDSEPEIINSPSSSSWNTPVKKLIETPVIKVDQEQAKAPFPGPTASSSAMFKANTPVITLEELEQQTSIRARTASSSSVVSNDSDVVLIEVPLITLDQEQGPIASSSTFSSSSPKIKTIPIQDITSEQSNLVREQSGFNESSSVKSNDTDIETPKIPPPTHQFSFPGSKASFSSEMKTIQIQDILLEQSNLVREQSGFNESSLVRSNDTDIEVPEIPSPTQQFSFPGPIASFSSPMKMIPIQDITLEQSNSVREQSSSSTSSSLVASNDSDTEVPDMLQTTLEREEEEPSFPRPSTTRKRPRFTGLKKRQGLKRKKPNMQKPSTTSSKNQNDPEIITIDDSDDSDDSNTDDAEETYDVERIVGRRTINGKVEYFIKWENYPETENSWEPEHNLSCCEDKIKDYEESRESGPAALATPETELTASTSASPELAESFDHTLATLTDDITIPESGSIEDAINAADFLNNFAGEDQQQLHIGTSPSHIVDGGNSKNDTKVVNEEKTMSKTKPAPSKVSVGKPFSLLKQLFACGLSQTNLSFEKSSNQNSMLSPPKINYSLKVPFVAATESTLSETGSCDELQPFEEVSRILYSPRENQIVDKASTSDAVTGSSLSPAEENSEAIHNLTEKNQGQLTVSSDVMETSSIAEDDEVINKSKEISVGVVVSAPTTKLLGKKKQRLNSKNTKTKKPRRDRPRKSRSLNMSSQRKSPSLEEDSCPYYDGPDWHQDSCTSEDDNDVELNYSILTKCPEGKRLAKIHSVTPIDGFLTFLVQWKERGADQLVPGEDTTNNDEILPAPSNKNMNMVRARAMNLEFPDKVIEFYQQNCRFLECPTSIEEEDEKAHRALMEAKERESKILLEESMKSSECDVCEDDPAELAIDLENRKKDKFNTRYSDLSSTDSEDDDMLLGSDDESGYLV